MVVHWPAPTALLERFELLRPLSTGGMAGIVVAFDQHRGDTCCVKMLSPGSSELSGRRFLAEARLMLEVDHPHVMKCRAYGVHEERPWYAMDRMQGTLEVTRKRKEEQPVDPLQATEWMVQGLAGLHALHQRGVIHRDVKLANLLVDANDVVHVADLGLAHHPADSVSFRTQPGSGLGTGGYAAPELMVRASEADLRADLFSVAVCFFELVTHRRPSEFVLRAHENGLEGVPEPFDAALCSIGALRAEHRYESARAVAEALCRAADTYARDHGREPPGHRLMRDFDRACPPTTWAEWLHSWLWWFGLK